MSEKTSPPIVLICDDDVLAAKRIDLALRDGGLDVVVSNSAQECLALWQERTFDLALVDVMMPPEGFDWIEAKGGFETGVLLARQMKRLRSETPIVGMSQAATHEAARWFITQASGLWEKAELLGDPDSLVQRVQRVIHPQDVSSLRAFIVHGHDHQLKDELEQYLASLGITQITILWDLPWRGRTLIEKFEQAARQTDVAFVLLTADDLSSSRLGLSFQPRPNVIFELGFFIGALRRTSGRIVILVKGHVDLPSDLHGVGIVDVSDGIRAADTAIRREMVGL